MLKFYNTLARKKQIFRPLRNKTAKIYACGPTVYWHAHLGNLKTYIFEDVLRRVLKYNGYKIKQAMNITDIEDKIIKKAQKEKKNIFQITEPNIKIFFNDLGKLNIEKAEEYPRATKHIKEMVDVISKLMKKNFAYRSDNGSIYFDISKFRAYGRLSQLQEKEIKIGARVNTDEYSKEQARDFVLWKAKKPNEPFWKSRFGDGRPGWHIECSAMAIKYLGETFDIHAGGVDLIFPHHENEIAQSESATGKKFANYWLHGEHLLVNNEKMSKSLGNIYTLRDLEQKKINPLAFRYLVLTSHYRSKLNFTWESLKAASNALNNLIYNFQLTTYNKQTKISNKENELKSNYEKEFLNAVNDDLNTPKAIALVWQIIKEQQLLGASKKELIIKFDKVFGLDFKKIKPLKIPLKIRQLAEKREKLRINKQFIPADLLRKKIEELGYIVEDTTSGPKVRKQV
jgi:cysteinyl-tRNA synthetase